MMKNRWAVMCVALKGSNARTRIDMDRTKAEMTSSWYQRRDPGVIKTYRKRGRMRNATVVRATSDDLRHTTRMRESGLAESAEMPKTEILQNFNSIYFDRLRLYPPPPTHRTRPLAFGATPLPGTCIQHRLLFTVFPASTDTSRTGSA